MAPEKGSSGIAKYEEVVLVLKHRNEWGYLSEKLEKAIFSHKIWMFLSTGAEQYLEVIIDSNYFLAI